ncbi:hypothetical protein HY285_03950 [Candidatus Peregrinibacteria bacterium]|nr:hypothetical protein [Candidatus Peregrinibacteria bacterium]MBI3816668.1 hypothetical protein [Candidatus Peregrinibacteria bacterium]
MNDPTPSASAPGTYRDEELVYADPESRTVVGPVEWSKSGNPKSRPIPKQAESSVPGEKKRSWRTYFPWGTYRSMKRFFRFEGKQKKVDPDKTLDQVIQKALEQAYWD